MTMALGRKATTLSRFERVYRVERSQYSIDIKIKEPAIEYKFVYV